MSESSLLDEIRRIKNTIKPVSKHAKQQQQLSKMQKTLTQAYSLRQKTISISSMHKVSESSLKFNDQQQVRCKQYSFEGKKFYFPIRDIELSNKRVDIFSQTIRKRGGFVLSQQEIFNKQVDYVISSHKASKYTVIQCLKRTKSQKQQVKYSQILSYHYIIDCQKQGYALPINTYRLYANKYQKEDDEQTFGEVKKFRIIQSQITDDEGQKNQQQSLSSTVSLQKIQKNLNFYVNKTQFTVKKQQVIVKKRTKLNNQVDKQKFSCQKGSSQSKFSVNQYIYEELMEFYNVYESEKDVGRKIAYLKAASAIKSYHKQIQSERDIIQLRGIGKKIVNKVKQLLQTGQIQKLQKLQQNQETLICQQLSRVWGIGAAKAKQFYQKGITSIEKLRERQDLLNKNQRVGLKYLQDFQQRIPRQKVQRIYQYVRGRIWQMVESQDLHTIQVCGSYRRGKQSCGDIDIIITRKDGKYEDQLVIDLINKLQKQGFITDHLNIPSRRQNDSNKSISYMGVCIFQSEVHHRIDIKYYPLNQFAFATLYFTGSDMFNRSMRLFARKKGYSLSDHGLTLVQRNGSNQKIWKGGEISLLTQKQIFQFLGLDYKTPQQRNI